MIARTALALAAVVVATPAIAADLSPVANQAYLDSNARKAGVTVLPGIQYRVIKSGTGAQPGRHDCASVNYAGRLIDGTRFEPTEPNKLAAATFPVNGVIGGWTEALLMMHEGDDWEVTIPAGLAYGHAGAGDGVIPPDQTLVFEIQLVKVFAPPAGGTCD
jgi:FKBP-type peptidyl-prolyl cis-trans isomerase